MRAPNAATPSLNDRYWLGCGRFEQGSFNKIEVSSLSETVPKPVRIWNQVGDGELIQMPVECLQSARQSMP